MTRSFISVKGAKEHNLKNIDVNIPRDELVVITGVSGSGKSTLAFDILYAEGQRRYVESLSAYARQFLEQMSKPDVESIDGLSAAIAIEQKTLSKNPRSTVGTVTEIYDYLRLLFARVGKTTCPKCHSKITAQSSSEITDKILKLGVGKKITIFAPIVIERKGEYKKELRELRQSGFVRVRVDGKDYELSEEIHLEKQKKHNIDVYVDRIVLKKDIGSRLKKSTETALGLTNHVIKIQVNNDAPELISTQFSCITCGTSLPEIEPRLFSFNSLIGFCKICQGTGLKDITTDIDEFLSNAQEEITEEHMRAFDFGNRPCEKCNGARLSPEALAVKIDKLSISEVCKPPLDQTLAFFEALKLSNRDKIIADRILKEIKDRLRFLLRVGVSYLSLDRRAGTLSGGEGRRIRLAAQIGSALTGVLYVLDEPSIGLHPRDNAKLIASLKSLRDHGNTVLVVEHDRDTMLSADTIIDMGPGAGKHGGKIVSQGTVSAIKKDKASLTGAYLTRKKQIDIPQNRRKSNGKFITIEGAAENNLKQVDLKIPIGLFTCITGVSGSGKSSLIIDTLYPAISNRLNKTKNPVGKHKRIDGLDHIERVIDVDQSPIGRTPRSNPATYTGLFSFVREFFAQLPESKIRGYKPGRYSFNVKGGRCETCMGAGLIKMEMHFLPNMYVECEMCQGLRYNRETLEVRYRDKNISEILDLTVEDALKFFARIPHIKSKLVTLQEVGLGYVHLGQQATTLSGGEAQRIKLSKELSKKSRGKALYILDEPTTGLHFHDIKKLLEVLQKLVDLGNTVIVIEHNLEMIKTADHIIDLGPEGGVQGGQIIAQGTPEDLAKNQSSYTGTYLKRLL